MYGIHRIGADPSDVVERERRDPTLTRHRHPTPHNMISGMNVGDETLVSVGHEFHGPFQAALQPQR